MEPFRVSLSGLYSFPLFPLVNLPVFPKNVAFPQGFSLDFPPLSFMTFSFSFIFFYTHSCTEVARV